MPLNPLASTIATHKMLTDVKRRQEQQDPLEGQEDEDHIPEFVGGTTVEEEAQAGDDPTPDAPQRSSDFRPGSVTGGSSASVGGTSVSEITTPISTTPTIHERVVKTATRDGSEIKIMGWRTTNENEIFRIIKDDVAVSDFYYSLGDASNAYIKGLHTNTFTTFKPKVFEEPVDEKPDVIDKQDDIIPMVLTRDLTGGTGETGNVRLDIPTSGRLMGEGDKGVTSGTARPVDLPHTFEGARESLSMGGTYAPTLDEILRKTGTYESDETQRDLKRVYDVGTDEKGDTVFINESPYQVLHNYTPNDPDFAIIKKDINAKLTGEGNIDITIDTIRKNIGQANTAIGGLKTDLTTIKGAREDTTWKFGFNETQLAMQNPDMYNWINTNVGFKDQYTKTEAEKIVTHFIDKNQDVINQGGSIDLLEKDKQSLQNTLKTVEQYENLGWEVDITDEGYKFHLPSEEDVHSAIFGDKEGIGLASSAFMESPLAIKTFGSAIWEKVSGDKKVGETRKKELISYSLGLQEKIQQKDVGGYIGAVATSPAMVQGVYIPLTAYAGGYALTGLSAGASGATAVGTSTLSKIGSTAGGQLLTTGTKTMMIGAGALGIATTGRHLITTYQEKPEALAGELAEVGFTFGMAYAGFKGGQKTWTQKHTGSWKYNWKSGKTEWSPHELKRVDIRGLADTLEYKMGDKSVFTMEGVQKVGGKDVYVRLHGVGEPMKGAKDISFSKGKGHIIWTEKGKAGTIITKTKWFGFKSAGKEIKISAPKTWKAYSSVSESKFLSGGQPTTGRGTSLVKDWGKIKIVDKGIPGQEITFKLYGGAVETTLPLPKKFTSIYSGTYEGQGTFGSQFQLGRTFSFKIGATTEGGGAVGGSGGAISQTDYGLLFGKVGQEAITMVAKDAPVTPLGHYTGIGGLGDTTTIVKADTTTTHATQATTPVADLKISGSPGGVVLVGTPKVAETKQDTKTDQDYFTRQDVYTGSAGVSDTKTDQQLMTTQAVETSQDLKPDIMKRETDFMGTGLKVGGAGILETESDTKIITEIAPGTFMSDLERTDILSKPGTDMRQGVRTSQKQKLGLETMQKQKLKLAQKTDLISVTVATPITVTTTTPIPVMPKPPFIPDDQDKLIRQKPKKKKTSRKPKIMEVGEKNKGLLSDLLSVTVSHARHGTATHPKLTKKVWKAGEKSLYMHVPTKELTKAKKKKKKKKPKLMRRQKNVFI